MSTCVQCQYPALKRRGDVLFPLHVSWHASTKVRHLGLPGQSNCTKVRHLGLPGQSNTLRVAEQQGRRNLGSWKTMNSFLNQPWIAYACVREKWISVLCNEFCLKRDSSSNIHLYDNILPSFVEMRKMSIKKINNFSRVYQYNTIAITYRSNTNHIWS